MGSKLLGSALAVTLLLGTAASAVAAPSAADKETARRLMDEGKAFVQSGEYAKAVDSYKKAHDIMPVPTTGLALAKARAKVGLLVEAREVALEVVRMRTERGEPAVFGEARKEARELEAELAKRIPTVRVRVTNSETARITLDDAEVPPLVAHDPIPINPGKHVFAAKSVEGEARLELEIAEKDVKTLELTLVAKPGDTAKKAAPPAATPAAPLANEDEKGRRTPTATALLFGGFGLAAVGAIVGGVTGTMTLTKANDVKPQCENGICDPLARGDLDSAKTLATVSTISFIAAGVFAAVGVVGLVLPRESAATTGTLRVRFGPTGVMGAF